MIDINHYRGSSDFLINPYILDVTSTLRNLTSIVNPLLYAGTDPKFKSVFRAYLWRRTDADKKFSISMASSSYRLSESEARRLSKTSFEFNRSILQSRFLRTGRQSDGGVEELSSPRNFSMSHETIRLGARGSRDSRGSRERESLNLPPFHKKSGTLLEL